MIDKEESRKRHKMVADGIGAHDCAGLLHEDLLVPHEDGYAVKKLLGKGWELNDYSPSESLIELANLKNGERFWVDPINIFYKPFEIGQKQMLIKTGAKNINDANYHLKVVLDRFDAIVFRKRHYLLAVFVPAPADQEAAQV